MAMELRMTVITGVLELRSGLNPSGQLVVSVYKVVFYIKAIIDFSCVQYGRTYSGIKRLFLPCCIKGKFYANLTLLHKGKILCQPRLAVTARQAFMPSSLA